MIPRFRILPEKKHQDLQLHGTKKEIIIGPDSADPDPERCCNKGYKNCHLSEYTVIFIFFKEKLLPSVTRYSTDYYTCSNRTYDGLISQPTLNIVKRKLTRIIPENCMFRCPETSEPLLSLIGP
jgi:hypothetical protein